ncbi:hypothetical protein [Neptunomonas concharum]|uniref:Penicillin-binding protein activator LpoB n=1 Tax=Neptunomonas concharum TaxID=1031538 RepID=A0A5P1RC72_9GAMM|nr:hypothetical protein [Neptunomonas concharum]QEQ97264.1 hypothetical protein F0U83_11375 [Neptunomonas concharum]
MNIKQLFSVSLMAVVLAGCNTMPGKGGQAGVSVMDPNSRAHLDTELTMADYTAFAENVTNKMLSSQLVQKWGSKKPRLIVSRLQNNTDNENIRMQDIHDRITETILNSGVARLVDTSATRFDYVVRTELSSTRQYGADGAELAFFKLEFKMFKIDGEMVGQWSDVLPLGRAQQKFL